MRAIWIDTNEWQSLDQLGLTDRIHLVFSTAWQAQVLRQQQQAVEERLRRRMGEADFAELQRLTFWVLHHPHSSEIPAYLLEHLRAVEPAREARFVDGNCRADSGFPVCAQFPPAKR